MDGETAKCKWCYRNEHHCLTTECMAWNGDEAEGDCGLISRSSARNTVHLLAEELGVLLAHHRRLSNVRMNAVDVERSKPHEER